MPDAIGSPRAVNLNTASLEELEGLGVLGREKAERIIDHRPFEGWDDLKRIKGFSESLIRDLKATGAIIRGPHPKRRPFPPQG